MSRSVGASSKPESDPDEITPAYRQTGNEDFEVQTTEKHRLNLERLLEDRRRLYRAVEATDGNRGGGGLTVGGFSGAEWCVWPRRQCSSVAEVVS